MLVGPLVSAWFLRRWLGLVGFVLLFAALPLVFVSLAAERVLLIIGMALVVSQVALTLHRPCGFSFADGQSRSGSRHRSAAGRWRRLSILSARLRVGVFKTS